MKLYVITIDDVYDYETTSHKPLICFTKKEVKATIKQLKDQVKRDTPSWKLVCNKSDEGFEFYLDGEFSCNHYVASVYEYDVELNITPSIL